MCYGYINNVKCLLSVFSFNFTKNKNLRPYPIYLIFYCPYHANPLPTTPTKHTHFHTFNAANVTNIESPKPL